MFYAIKKDHSRHQRAGFTMVEMMVVIGIIGMLLLVVVPRLTQFGAGAKKTATRTVLSNTNAAINRFEMDTLKLPASLKDLVIKPQDQKIASRWNGPYLEDLPEDAWGNPLKFELTPGKEKRYTILSWGVNGPGSDSNEWITY